MSSARFTRHDISFASDGDEIAGWLYRPTEEAAQPQPIVVLAHGLGALRTMGLDRYAAHFAGAGYLALAFDYRYFGASGGEPRHLIDLKRQRADWRAAIAHARTLPGVDPDRVVLWGSSLSAGHVVTVAASDQRIAAVIAQVPFTDGIASSLAPGVRTLVKASAGTTRDAIAGALR